jgi:hypothetical protein
MPWLMFVLCLGFLALTLAGLGCAYFLMRCACELINLRIALVSGFRGVGPYRDDLPT